MLRIFHIFDVLAEPDKKDKEYKDVTPPTGKNKFEAKLTSDMSSSSVWSIAVRMRVANVWGSWGCISPQCAQWPLRRVSSRVRDRPLFA